MNADGSQKSEPHSRSPCLHNNWIFAEVLCMSSADFIWYCIERTSRWILIRGIDVPARPGGRGRSAPTSRWAAPTSPTANETMTTGPRCRRKCSPIWTRFIMS